MKIFLPPRPVSDSRARVLSRLCREFRSSSTLARHTLIFPSGFQTSKFPQAFLRMSTNGSRPSVQNCQCRPGPPGSPESSGTIVAPRDLLLNDCDGRAAFCNSERFVRGELGGVFNDMFRVSLGMVVCCGAGLSCSAREQDDHEACWPTWTDAPCFCARVPNFVP